MFFHSSATNQVSGDTKGVDDILELSGLAQLHWSPPDGASSEAIVSKLRVLTVRHVLLGVAIAFARGFLIGKHSCHRRARVRSGRPKIVYLFRPKIEGRRQRVARCVPRHQLVVAVVAGHAPYRRRERPRRRHLFCT